MHEHANNYGRVGGLKCCALKVDIMKVFDTVSWRYLMKNKIMNSIFSFHPKCEHTELSSLAFDDDLFILSQMVANSTTPVRETLQEFQNLSGLSPNLQKNENFTSGIFRQEKTRLSEVFCISLVSLPIRYLGFPLVSEKISYTDCRRLLDMLASRVQTWTTKYFQMEGNCN